MKYSESSKKELLSSLIAKAFNNGSVDTSITEEISLQLRTIPDNEKSKFYDFVKKYLEEGFSYGFIQDNIYLQDFAISDTKSEEQIIIEELEAEKIEINKSLASFKDLFDSIKSYLSDYFLNYKGYFITELRNDYSFEYELVFIYEDSSNTKSLEKKVMSTYHGVKFLDLSDEKLTEKLEQNKNYLCIFLLTSKVNVLTELGKQIQMVKDIIDNFAGFEYHTLATYFSPNTNKEIQIENSINSKEKFIEDIRNFSSMFLSNIRLNFEEEKIIKKLCQRIKSNLIFYKILAGGYSGSKVIEIRPKKTYDQKNIYILKIGCLEDKKVLEERNNYDEYIPHRAFAQYFKPDYESTLLYEGLMYDYAISNEANDSFSFSDYVHKDKLPNVDVATKKQIINDLFLDNELFTYWRKEFNETKSNNVKSVYADYLSRDKIASSLKNILENSLAEQEFLTLFDKIWNHSFNYKETVCHGDLHTENFFIDDTNKIFLIDFGHTNKRHSLIDYVALECSLKFKHFPFYLESIELQEIENELLSDNTFNLSHNFTSTKRKEILEFLSLINSIRNCSKKDLFDESNHIEYYIALFIMTIRQIRYPNMNQLYAYHSAKIIGTNIISKLNL